MFADAGHMTAGAEGAVFGDDRFSVDGYTDVSFGGAGIVGGDTVQNGKGAIAVDGQNRVTVDLKKPLDSGDSSGKDIAWSTGNTYSVTIMWDSNDAGSSGGSVSCYNGALTSKTLLVNAEAVPEFPAALILAALAATLVAAVFLKKRDLTCSHQVFQYR